MFRSTEVRWFLRGDVPGEMRRWFTAGEPGKTEPTRIDDYLLLQGCRTTSVKLRGGHFEVKAQTQAPEPVSFRHGISGLRDGWVKWSSNRGDSDVFRSLFLRAEDRWLSVEKNRLLRLISLVADEPAEVTPGGAWLARGCQVELTAIRAWSRGSDENSATSWWSLSFEAFGEPATLGEDLHSAVEFVLDQPPPVRLDRESAMSYPEWLARNPLRVAG